MSLGRREVLACALALACLLAALGPAAAPAAVYWAENGQIGAANLDGTSPNPAYFKPPFPSDSAGPGCGLAASDSYLYWVGAFGIGRVNLDGPATPATVSPHLEQPCGVAIDAAHLYWADAKAGTLGRANLDGSEPNPSLLAGLDRPCGVAVDGSHLYWVDWRGIGRARLDGTQPEPEFVHTGPASCGLAADSQYLYWGSQGAIGRVRLDGLFGQPAFITGVGGVGAIAVDSAHVYWTDWREGMVYSTIGRAGIDGSGVNRSWIPTETFNLGGVAVDARPVPSPRPLPSQPVQFGKLRHSLRNGSLVLDVWVARRGDLAVTAPAVGWKVLKGDPPPYLEGSFRWRLKVWPGKTRFGRKVRARLLEKGRAVVTLRTSYAETGQLPATATKRVALLQRRR
ncbi:MAG TPA: hypothetical protein VN733_03735 [Solirubrobacterales bacterium]|nr:hypothetical protein [Solirubrobacterales bacterium]